MTNGILTPEEYARAVERLRDPAPGNRIAAVCDLGIDLTLLIGQLRLTPAERAREMEEVCRLADEVRGRAGLARRFERN